MPVPRKNRRSGNAFARALQVARAKERVEADTPNPARLTLAEHKCGFCEHIFYVLPGAASSLKRCPFCGSSDQFDETRRIEVLIEGRSG